MKIENELGDLHTKIDDWRGILADDAKVLQVVEDELNAMREKYGDDRRTEIAHVSGEVDIEDLIPEEESVFTLTHAGYIKRQPSDTYQAQRRGGRGITALSRKDEDFVEELFLASTHDYILFVTDMGRVYRLKGYQVYEGSRTSRGVNIVNLLPLQDGEQVTSMLRVPGGDNAEGYLTMVTKAGVIKRTALANYSNIRKNGLIAINLNEGDSLAWTRITSGEDELIVATRNGMAIRISENDARPLGRTATGVRAIRLKEGDSVVGVGVVREGATVLTVTEEGKGRRTDVRDYRTQYRGGLGIRNYGSKGHVAGLKVIDDTDDIILISLEGIIIRMHVEDINVQSRYGSGVRVMRLGEGDRVVTVARTEHSDEEETAKPEDDGAEEELSCRRAGALEAEEAQNAAGEEDAARRTASKLSAPAEKSPAEKQPQQGTVPRPGEKIRMEGLLFETGKTDLSGAVRSFGRISDVHCAVHDEQCRAHGRAHYGFGGDRGRARFCGRVRVAVQPGRRAFSRGQKGACGQRAVLSAVYCGVL